MSLFISLLIKILPLYLMIVLGFIAAKQLHVQKEPIAKLLIYMLMPAVVFFGAYTSPLNVATLSLPVITFIISLISGLLFLGIGHLSFKDSTLKHILAFAASTGNSGYFGLPVALALFGHDAFSLIILSALGITLFENSIGFYITAKGNHTAKESLYKVLRLPALYAFTAGLTLNKLGVSLDVLTADLLPAFKGGYTLFGMMLIGMGLSTVTLSHIDWRFISLSFIAKFVCWPALMFSVLWADAQTFQLFSDLAQNVLILISIVPLAANTVAVAAELKIHPDKAAVAVLLSTLVALGVIPLVIMLL